MRFKISQKELQKRSKHIISGAFFAGILMIFIVYNNAQYPETYNDVLFWSIIGFIVLTNLVGYFRYRRYWQKARDHWLEIHSDQLKFFTQGNVTQLNINEIAALNFFRRQGKLQHIQIKLRNNRGIRLEGYNDIDLMAEHLSARIPKAHITDKQ
jgi:hypothetical protein